MALGVARLLENQVISSMELISLKSPHDGKYRNYMAVACVKVDTGFGKPNSRFDSNEFYSSTLGLYQIRVEESIFTLKTVHIANFKRSITCVTGLLGRLIASI